MKNILVSGQPGVGKTTLVRKLSEIFKEFNPAGFYTHEMIEAAELTGYQVSSLFGDGRIIAHNKFKSNYRVGKFRVDVKVFDKMLEDVFAKDKKIGLYIIDEIGKMQSLSKKFSKTVLEILDSEKVAVATIPEKGQGFIQDIRKRHDVKIVEITPDNREQRLKELTLEIRDLLLG